MGLGSAHSAERDHGSPDYQRRTKLIPRSDDKTGFRVVAVVRTSLAGCFIAVFPVLRASQGTPKPFGAM